MDSVRPVHPDEVKLPIDEETKLVCSLVAPLVANGIERPMAINEAFKIVDEVLRGQESRKEERIKIEYRRRKGY